MEDLHWVDPSTLELIGRIVEQAPTVSVLAVLTHRPDFEPPWASALPRNARLGGPPLAPAGDRDGRERRRRDGGFPKRWCAPSCERTDGVPLFVEELTKALLDSDVVGKGTSTYTAALELAIPATLQDSLTARLDGLSPAKEVAQLAATVGREFRYEVLAGGLPAG